MRQKSVNGTLPALVELENAVVSSQQLEVEIVNDGQKAQLLMCSKGYQGSKTCTMRTEQEFNNNDKEELNQGICEQLWKR